MRFSSRAEAWDFDIDHYLNRIIPPSPLHRLPAPITRFLGYRKEQDPDVGNVLAAFYSCVGAFCGLAVVAAVFNHAGVIQARHPPAMIASFGASAVLEYNVIRSPLSQPRNTLLGHSFSALIGVAVTKLFLFHQNFEQIRWIAGAVSCGLASAVMLLTGTVHPPGGASAVLAATSPEITEMGWYFVGLVMLGTTLMVAVGLVVNNLQRQFPVYWWTPLDVRRAAREDEESVSGSTQGGLEFNGDLEDGRRRQICISAQVIALPEGMALDQEEAKLLEKLRERLGNLDRIPSAGTARSSTDITMVSLHHTASDTSAA